MSGVTFHIHESSNFERILEYTNSLLTLPKNVAHIQMETINPAETTGLFIAAKLNIIKCIIAIEIVIANPTEAW